MNSVSQHKIQIVLEEMIKGKGRISEMTNELNDFNSFSQRMSKKMGISSEEFNKNWKAQGQNFTQVSESMVQQSTLLANKQKFYQTQMKSLGVTGKQVDDILSHYGFTFDKNGQLIDKAGRKIKNINKLMEQGKVKTQGFNMSLLSTMFFGMALQRTFNGLIKTSLEWVGIQELLNTTLGVVFLPIAEELLELLLPIMAWFMDMPESMKKVIGGFVLLGSAIGAAMTVFGTLGLGMQGLGQVFGIDLSKGLIAGLKTKLGGVNISRFLKYGAATIFFGLALKDGAEGEILAALGDVGAGIGMLGLGAKGAFGKAAPWLIVAGLLLKFIGDKEFQIGFYKFAWKIIDYALFVGEVIQKALTGKWAEIDWGNLKFFNSSSDALNRLIADGEIASDSLRVFAENNAMLSFSEDVNTLTDSFSKSGGVLNNLEDYDDKLGEIYGKYPSIVEQNDDLTYSLTEQAKALKEVKKSYDELSFGEKVGMFLKNARPTLGLEKMFGGKEVSDAIISPNGDIITTNPNDYLIATQNPSGLTGNNKNVNMNVTYYVTVSDKREFEEMLQKNNRELASITRRSVKV